MKQTILKLLTEGDCYLKEAKSDFLIRQEEQCSAANKCSKSIKKYLEAYRCFLTSKFAPSNNYHVLFHGILQADPEFNQFYEKIFQVKCFAEESKRYKEDFFLYDDEINSSINISCQIRNYILRKLEIEKQFLSEYLGTCFMAI
jgi:hypothetical protein